MRIIKARESFYKNLLPVTAGIVGCLVSFEFWFNYDTTKLSLDHTYAAKEAYATSVHIVGRLNHYRDRIEDEKNEAVAAQLKAERSKYLDSIPPINSINIKADRLYDEMEVRDVLIKRWRIPLALAFSSSVTLFFWCLYRLKDSGPGPFRRRG